MLLELGFIKIKNIYAYSINKTKLYIHVHHQSDK